MGVYDIDTNIDSVTTGSEKAAAAESLASSLEKNATNQGLATSQESKHAS